MLLLLRAGGADGGTGCLPPALVAAHAVLALVDGGIAAVAFLQLLRMHLRNQQLGWTRQKLEASKKITQDSDASMKELTPRKQVKILKRADKGYFLYFIFTVLATCERWLCWSNGCGFILMACPQILSLAAFLLLLSFWVDLCHQSNDEDEDEENSYSEPFLEKSKNEPSSLHLDGHRRCCSFRAIYVGSRQKFVILVIVLTFVSMIAFALLIWAGRGRNPIDSSLLSRVYLDIFSVAIFLLGGALACYGVVLSLKMRKVRSEMASTEMWKVAGLAAVSLICFTSCAILALVTNVPLQVLAYWQSEHSDNISSSIFIFLYYFIGSSVPPGFVLWVMRDMPPPLMVERPVQSRIVTFIRDEQTASSNLQWRTAVTTTQNKVLKGSPI